MTIAFVDFDHTLISKDSLLLFINHVHSKSRVLLGWILLSPLMLAYYLKIISTQQFKEKVLFHFLKKMSKDEITEKAISFNKKLHKYYNTEVYNQTLSLKTKGAKVVVVSASLNSWLEPFCEQHGFDLISTEASFNAKGLYAKHFKTPNCKGADKKKRITEKYTLEDYTDIICIGNKDDKEMLNLASSEENSILV